MLINNLQKHKQKYSSIRRYESAEYRPQSKVKQSTIFDKKNHYTSYNLRSGCNLKSMNSNQLERRPDQQKSVTRTRSKIQLFNYEKKQVVLQEQVPGTTVKRNNFFEGTTNSKISSPKYVDSRLTAKIFKKLQDNNFEPKFSSKWIEKKLLPQENQIIYHEEYAKTEGKPSILQEMKEQNRRSSMKFGSYETNQLRKSDKKLRSTRNIFEHKHQRILKEEEYDKVENVGKKVSLEEIQPINPQNQKMQNQFLSVIKFHEVFFCCSCYKFIFGIEKKMHEPTCQSKVDFDSMNTLDTEKMGMSRLQMIRQLSQYTKTRVPEVSKLIEKKNDREYKRTIEKLKLPSRRYLKLQEIENAAALVIIKFFNRSPEPKNQIFCTFLDNQLTSNSDERE